MRVKLSSLPDPPKEYTISFPRLDGGLNTWELDYRLDNNESPDVVNLWWQDGALCCRDGQARLTDWESPGAGWSAYERLFWGHGLFHIGSGLYHADLSDPTVSTLTPALLLEGVPENRGSWFAYGDHLYYKNRGGYYRVGYDAGTGEFSAEDVPAYSPIIQINTEPATAAGDTYQPENRIHPQKTVWYTAPVDAVEYHLPVQGVDSVDLVEVDGVALPELEALPEPEETGEETEAAAEEESGEEEDGSGEEETPVATGYVVDLENGVVTFDYPPKYHVPAAANTVKITYTKANPDAMASIMDCPYAVTFGGSQELCVVVGGSTAQPNAYFWCGNHIAMDPGYFPMEQYNLAGATEELITGFGKQQSMLVIFKERSVGRAVMSTTEMNTGRVLITMDYTPVNSQTGCDLPWTIRLVENNLVFCNARQGVQLVADSSAAYENNILPISRKVNNGLLPLVRRGEPVYSFDDGSRYWVVSGQEVYAWDYTLSTASDPSWFYFTGIKGAAFIRSQQASFQLESGGHIGTYRRSFADDGAPIRKVYQFPTQTMGGYDRLKDVTGALLAVRGDTNTDIDLTWGTDYETRKDRTPIRSYTWSLLPRNLAFRYLGVMRFATVVRRRPGCRHVRHFFMRLENQTEGTDMSVVSAQIFYKYQGRQR